MTQFFTIMIISFVVPNHGEMHSFLLYPSEKACGDALPAVYDTILPHYPDSMAQCQVTRLLSASPRPKARPFKEKNDEE